MMTITIEQAGKNLAALLERARAGEEIIISDGQEPGVRLEPVGRKPSLRGFGALKGKINVPDEDLFGPLPEDELKRWHGEGE
jgi:antitoxin (DNA-binding transcriptional repressor) of toxin-antitoxin stability system